MVPCEFERGRASINGTLRELVGYLNSGNAECVVEGLANTDGFQGVSRIKRSVSKTIQGEKSGTYKQFSTSR